MVQEWFKNFFSTAAVTIFLIMLAGIITGDDSVKMISLISAIVANLIIHLGLIGIRKISSVYYFLEMLLEFAYVLGVVLLLSLIHIYASIGKNAKQVIETEFSYEHCGKILLERLGHLK